MKVTCSDSVFAFMLYFHTIHSRPLRTLRAVRPALLWAITKTHTCLLITVSVSFKAPSIGTWIDRDLKCVGPWRDLLFYALKPGDSPHGVLINYPPTYPHTHTHTHAHTRTHTHTHAHTRTHLPLSHILYFIWENAWLISLKAVQNSIFRVGMTCESGSTHLPWVKSFHRVTVETWMLRWIWLIQEQNRKSHPCGESGFAKLIFRRPMMRWPTNGPTSSYTRSPQSLLSPR